MRRALIALAASALLTSCVTPQPYAGRVASRTPAPQPTNAAPSPARSATAAPPAPTASVDPAVRLPGGASALAPLPPGVPFVGHLLIADRGNGRIVEIAPSGEMTWSFPPPGDGAAAAMAPWDDAHYAPDGRVIHANSDQTSTVIAIDPATRRILWRAGTPNRPGKGTTGFTGPDDAVGALDGTVYLADIRNCRVVHLGADGSFLGSFGSGACVHDPPRSFSSPNGAYPAADGDLIVTEIGGPWISRIGADGTLRWTFRAALTYPSDAVPYADGSVLVTDYVSPGAVLRLAPDGRVLWRFDAGGKLHNPSSAVPVAANRVAISDDFGNRILLVDTDTNAIVREYTSAGGMALRVTDCVDWRPD